MHALELPHARTCLVCGRNNSQGLKLCLHVVPDTGMVSTEYLPEPEHVGFDGIIHGGMLATVMDEAMTWAATWKNKRFCICGEMTARFRHAVRPAQALRVEAVVEFFRPKLVEVASKMFDFTGVLVATGSGKYIPVTVEEHVKYLKTFVEEPHTSEAAKLLSAAYEPAGQQA